MSIVEFKNVTYTYNDGSENPVRALDDVSFEINEGDFIALVGHNGSGKSTVAKLMNGLIEPNAGSILVDGMTTVDQSQLFNIRKTVGVVFQNPDNQMIATIIEDDVAFGPENLGLAPLEIRKRVDWALESVGMLEHKAGTPFRLSGGQKQRIAIAGVLAIAPKVMVLDESTAMLDPIGRKEVMRVIRELNVTHKMTVIMITHFMEEAADADRIIVLKEGKKVFDGGKEVFGKQEMLYSCGLDLPVAVKIRNGLVEGGLSLSEDIVDEKGLVEALCR